MKAMRVFARSLSIAALALILFVGAAGAQTRFVQITDPHLFDADLQGKADKLDDDQLKERRLDAERAFTGAIEAINRQIDGGANYEFLVITGDIGVAHWNEPISEAAKMMAEWLRRAKVERFLFVPGNNDVGNKVEYIGKYRGFISALKKNLPDRVFDLCEENFFDKERRLYIGLNNASFYINFKGQLSSLHSIQRRIKSAGKDIAHVYIFLHIPEIDDPHLIKTEQPNSKRSSYPYSAWGVSAGTRSVWHSILTESRVKGVFAGHFHTSDRVAYQRPFSWMRGKYPKVVLEKTYLCPPLSAKYQWNRDSRARGFQVVTLDSAGNPSVQIFWYENNHFSSAEVAKP
jgi:3',5'-cyclic AMP phosphodiesterase CpdA